ncbi:MAG: SET domain-containing protein [Myxococcales bacterium]|nr:SET domain-containing protein [Myxococcales bacterium]MBK7197285.1 SET domain-containing protein [Myxococcales bacterium]
MDAIGALMAWLRDAGATCDGLTVGPVPSGRGMVATRPIAAGEVVARIPRALLITREHARASSVGRQLRDANVELSSSHATFAAWLCVEARRATSPYAPYLRSLPAAYDGFAIHAPADERALLRGTLTGDRLALLEHDLARDHALAAARARLMAGVDRATFTWARLCVGSRAFAVTIDGVATNALVPLADLINHAPAPVTRWAYDQEAAAFTLTAVADVAAGAELTDSYGAKSNGQLAVQYGFTVDDNPADVAEIAGRAAGLPDDDEAAQALWKQLGRDRAPPAQVAAALAAACEAALARLPADDDDARLARPDLTPRARDFVRARRGERRVLAAWQARARAYADAAAPTARDRSAAIVAA